jgi:hypothetical protein
MTLSSPLTSLIWCHVIKQAYVAVYLLSMTLPLRLALVRLGFLRFPSLSSTNTVPHQQITINERVVNTLRLQDEVCIGSALI